MINMILSIALMFAAQEPQPNFADYPAQDAISYDIKLEILYKAYAGRQIPQVLCEFDSDDSKALPQRIYEIHDLSWGPHPPPLSDDKKPSQGQRN